MFHPRLAALSLFVLFSPVHAGEESGGNIVSTYKNLPMEKLQGKLIDEGGINHPRINRRIDDSLAKDILCDRIVNGDITPKKLMLINTSIIFSPSHLEKASDLEIAAYLIVAHTQNLTPPLTLFHHVKYRANEGRVGAQLCLGLMYMDARGVPEYELKGKKEKAIAWLTKAANQNNVRAQVQLGRLYDLGVGIKEFDDHENNKKASELYHKAARHGNATAQNYFGEMWENGRVDSKTKHLVQERNAVSWYEVSAKQGHMKAQTNLGRMYKLKRGIPSCDEANATKLAFFWFFKAAEQGCDEAQVHLAQMYEQGLNILKADQKENEARALELYALSAMQGNEIARKALDDLYEKGGVFPTKNGQVNLWIAKRYHKASL